MEAKCQLDANSADSRPAGAKVLEGCSNSVSLPGCSAGQYEQIIMPSDPDVEGPEQQTAGHPEDGSSTADGHGMAVAGEW